MINKKLFITSIFIFGLASFTVYGYWANPPGAPTSPNVDEPINVSSHQQYKAGHLELRDGLYVVGGPIEAGHSVTVTSDRRTKKNITELNRHQQLLNVEPVQYERRKDNKASVGFLAQDIERIYPELVSENNGLKSLNYSQLTAPILQIVREQEEKLERQQEEIDELRDMIKELQ